MTKNEYGIVIMADLEGAFDSVWRLRAVSKLHKAGVSENLLLIFASFMNKRQQRNLVNTYRSVVKIRNWGSTRICIKPINLLSITADMTA